MKKMNNKGFSLVELIIVIAIMAILAGAIAPALIRYIDKSRKSNDVTSCKTIKTAVETALGNESIYEYVTNCGTNDYTTITIVPGKATDDVTSTGAVVIGDEAEVTDDMAKNIKAKAENEIGTNIGERTPKIKFKKESVSGATPKQFYAFVTQAGSVYVVIGGDETPKLEIDDTTGLAKADGAYVICPEVCEEYQ